VKIGASVKMGYFAQHAMELLDPQKSVIETLIDSFPKASLGSLRTLAGAFGFSGDDVEKPCRVLSGGEKARVVLARMLFDPPNFLVLDEPTNHLDMETKEMLVEALKDFEGTMLFVSHDRPSWPRSRTACSSSPKDGAHLYGGGYTEYVTTSGREAPAGRLGGTARLRRLESVVRRHGAPRLRAHAPRERRDLLPDRHQTRGALGRQSLPRAARRRRGGERAAFPQGRMQGAGGHDHLRSPRVRAPALLLARQAPRSGPFHARRDRTRLGAMTWARAMGVEVCEAVMRFLSPRPRAASSSIPSLGSARCSPSPTRAASTRSAWSSRRNARAAQRHSRSSDSTSGGADRGDAELAAPPSNGEHREP
jgi:hypothetical protein